MADYKHAEGMRIWACPHCDCVHVAIFEKGGGDSPDYIINFTPEEALSVQVSVYNAITELVNRNPEIAARMSRAYSTVKVDMTPVAPTREPANDIDLTRQNAPTTGKPQ